jgi:hypothetical protein
MRLLQPRDPRDKPIAPARDRLDATVASAAFVKNPAQRSNLNGQIVWLDSDVRPCRIHDRVFGHQRAGLFQQRRQDVPRARADRYRRPGSGAILTEQAARPRVESPAFKRQDLADHGRIHASSPPCSGDESMLCS